MQVVHDRASLRASVAAWKSNGERVALVPTMGNLHDGHISLIGLARKNADRVVASVFVNPTQFGPDEDFESYPRTLDRDAEQLRRADCDLLFAPDIGVIYPRGAHNAFLIRAPADLAGKLEGRIRPGHFDGVVTVVARLFALIDPHCAVFGEKDFQQLLVVRRLVDDLGFDIEIIAAPTRREQSGLAMSSRNGYLSAEQRAAAAALNATLQETARRMDLKSEPIGDLESWATDSLNASGFSVEYVAIRREEDLAPPCDEDRKLRILVAAKIGTTRLIDNIGFER